MSYRRFAALPVVAASLFVVGPVAAKDIAVQMKNSGGAGIMVFEPSFIRAAPGDTIRFLPTDAGHNAEIIPGMIPAGVEPSAGEIGKEFDLKVTKRGLYGIRCKPHFSLGMVALVKVGPGAAPNAAAAAAVALPTMAARRMTPMLAAAQAPGNP